MLLPELVIEIVLGATFGVGVAAFVAFIVLRGMRKRARLRSLLSDVPLGEEDKRRRRRQVWSGLLAAGLLAVGIAMFIVLVQGSPVTIVTETRSIEKQYVVGSTSIDVRGSSVTIEGMGAGKTWIVNRAEIPVVVRPVVYSQGALGLYSRQEEDLRYSPGSATVLAGLVDYFGPDDVPPRSLEAHGSYAKKRWLTW